jgi:hypothetical protein
MYHQVAIQKLSHNQILKLLRGDRIRVKHGHGHHIHASAEQHKKIMNAHKKGQGCTIQLDPFQQSMPEHHALKHKGGVMRHGGVVSHGEGWLGDAFKEVAKELAPHAIDWGARKIKEKIHGWGDGEGMHHGHPHAHHLHHAHHAHKRGRPKKCGKGTTEQQITLAGRQRQMEQASALQRQAQSAKQAAHFDSLQSQSMYKAPEVQLPPSTSHINYGMTSAQVAQMIKNQKQGAARNSVATPSSHSSSSSYTMPTIDYDAGYMSRSKGLHKKKHHAGGALYPAGYDGDGLARAPSRKAPARGRKGKGMIGEGKARAPARAPARGRRGKGIIGSLLGKTLGGVAGHAIGGKKHGHEAEQIGSLLGGIAGDFLPF